MKSVDFDSLMHTLQAVAWLLTDFSEIVELDLNPVFTGPHGAIVADGRAVLAEWEESRIKGTNYGK